jgi:hypothetical protein
LTTSLISQLSPGAFRRTVGIAQLSRMESVCVATRAFRVASSISRWDFPSERILLGHGRDHALDLDVRLSGDEQGLGQVLGVGVGDTELCSLPILGKHLVDVQRRGHVPVGRPGTGCAEAFRQSVKMRIGMTDVGADVGEIGQAEVHAEALKA